MVVSCGRMFPDRAGWKGGEGEVVDIYDVSIVFCG